MLDRSLAEAKDDRLRGGREGQPFCEVDADHQTLPSVQWFENHEAASPLDPAPERAVLRRLQQRGELRGPVTPYEVVEWTAMR